MRLAVTPAPDGDVIVAFVHDACFAGLRHDAAMPDDPRDHGHIPAQARCAFCNERLPVVGKHPVSFDVGSVQPPRRYWAHVSCLTERVRPALAERIAYPRPRPH